MPITSGPYEPTWKSIEANYPGTPEWLRDSKFGIWIHFGTQSAGESGDWYARKMYVEGTPAYENHLKNYGHPSEVGYKEVLRDWNPTKFNPQALVDIYRDAGARFLIIQGVHHDQFDMWDSKYQPWNSTRLGPKRDLIGEWEEAARKAGIRFGLTFHHEYSCWWWQTAFQSDTKGDKKGVPYDGNLTLADGKGKWWALRMMDAVDKYNLDFIYTDGTDQQPFSGSGTGTGYKCDAMQRVIADFYNKTLDRRGKVDVFSIVKFRKQTNGTVNTCETGIPENIKTDQAWIVETPVGDWFYGLNFVYSSDAVIRYLLEIVARDGAVGVSIPLRPEGSLDEGCVKMLKEVGEWMRINGQGIYGSSAWSVLGEGKDGKLNVLPGGFIGANQANHSFYTTDFRFTVGKDGAIYAWCMTVPKAGDKLKILSLGSDAGIGQRQVTSVELLGGKNKIEWKQEADGLDIVYPDSAHLKTAVGFRIVCKQIENG